MGGITLITGGGRSGKSSYALELAKGYDKKAFIATAMPVDDELLERIRRHKEQRDPSFKTMEVPLDLADAVADLSEENVEVAIIDCLTVWVGNCLHHQESITDVIIEAFIDSLKTPACDLIIVTNEVGLGIIPDNAMARKYRDVLGGLNQQVAKLADRVVLMVSGIPVTIKEQTVNE